MGQVVWRFVTNNGLIWADLGTDWPAFNEALGDSISSLAPRGSPAGLSTYWIDHALQGEHAKPGAAFTQGNSTALVRTEGGVRAEPLYETFEPEEMPLADFVELLREWRVAVETEMPSSLPAQAPYQRNPAE